ncbi:MAG: helix-turn-helix domain-containing protein [Alistipes indistinctus]|uniref:helix-turn-helix domain-containing protein n=1 Tax=Alistipes indistinctus TaxID=626932 RepID=UPI00241FB3C5|nr:helix-turn-helix domain-containing protein [Alistipes indistinctus]MBD9134172.1 helix-turn-helix domain-containing protein [Alistipes indistinctus]
MSDNFFVYTDISCLPLTEHATYLGEGFGGLCTGGTAVIDLFSMRRQISKNDLVTILPFQLGSIHKVSDDFSMIFFKVDKVMFMDIMSSLGRITPDFFFHMRKNFQVPISVNEAKRFLGFCRAIDFRTNNDDPAFRRETILHLLRIYYWDFYVHFQKKTRKRNTPLLNSNKESIAMKFAMLVFENRETHREVAYYADQLCISPLYLTKIIQEVNGQSARDMIADYTIIGIKTLLRNADITIKDVVRHSGFSSQSSFSRFFRKHTGMSPSEYRRTIHILK